VTSGRAEPPPAGDPAEATAPDHSGELARQTVIYGLSGIALPAVGIVTLPIFARAFTPTEYGLLELATVLSAVMLVIADAGFQSATARSFFDYRTNDAPERARVVFTGLASTVVVALVVAAVLAVARDRTSELLFERPGEGALLALVALSIPMVSLASFLREALRLHFKAGHYLVSAIAGAALSGALGIVAVLAFDSGVEGVFLGIALGNSAALAYGLIAVRGGILARFSPPDFRRMIAYGLPIVPAGLAMWTLSLVDRIMLGRLGALDEVGQYGVAARVAGVLTLGVTGFLLALGPYLLSIYSEDRALEKAVRGRILTYLAFTLSLGAVSLGLFARELVALVAPDYPDAYQAVGLLALAVVAFGISSIVMTGISLARRTTYFALLAGGAAGLNIALNLALIPAFGMVGAAAASAVGYGLLALLYYRVAQRLYPSPYEPRKVLAIVALAVVCVAPGAMPIEPAGLAIGVKATALTAFGAGVRLTGVIGPSELRELRRFVGGMFRFREARA
jgi:antigen flippase